MGEFFRGWRRKAGLATLAMALLLMAGWMRSYMNQEYVYVHRTPSHYKIISYDGRLRWVRDEMSYRQYELWSVPYWSLVLPLTLLSAWLILIKPRPAKSAKESNRA